MRQFYEQHAKTLAVIACALIILVAVGGRTGFSVTVPEFDLSYSAPPPVETVEQEQAPEEQLEPNPESNGPKIFITIALILLAVLLLSGAARLTQKFLSSRASSDPVITDDEDEDFDADLTEILIPTVSSALDEGLEALSRGGSPRNAIIGAWQSLEQAVQDSGIEREKSDTPTEFTVNALQSLPLSSDLIRQLLGLFHVARFTEQEMTHAQIELATTCVKGLRRDLENFERFKGGLNVPEK